MVQAEVAAADFFEVPEGSTTLLDTIEKNEDNQFRLPISEKIQLTHDTFKIVLKFPNEEWLMGLPLAYHMTFFAPPAEEGKPLVGRKYSPVSPMTQRGSVEFVIKCYPQCDEFPNGGYMGNYLRTLNVGDTILMEGPVGRLTYKGNATFSVKKQPRRITKLGLIAGGSGITPIFNIMDAVHRGNDQSVDIKMIYSNKTAGDILLKEELAKINAEASNITVTHTITRDAEVPADYLRGRVSIDMLQELNFPAPSEETLIYSCGPKAFNDAISAFLTAAGYSKDMIYP